MSEESKPAKLWLVRHGESAYNAKKRFNGIGDTILTDRGRSQAECLAERLAREHLDIIISSDLRRARETAEACASHHRLTVAPMSALRECSFGDWEGYTHAELEEGVGAEYRAWLSDPVTKSPPGGESLRVVAGRVVPRVAALVEEHPGKSVLLVMHDIPIRVLVCNVLGLDLAAAWRIRVDLASISRIDWHPGWPVLALLNETSHLPAT